MDDKKIVWLHGEIKSPPFSSTARAKAGAYLRDLQQRKLLFMPHSRLMPVVGAGCHELRVNDQDNTWRIIYRIDEDAVVVAEVFAKKTHTTPLDVINNCKRRLADYDTY